MRYRTAILFGVFDVLHAGHQALFAQAREKADALLVSVARDAAVQELKGQRPRHRERVRAAAVRRALRSGDRVVLGDAARGRYSAIRRFRPDVICLGYDQAALGRDLQQRMARGELPRIPICRLRPHHPQRYHTSLLR